MLIIMGSSGTEDLFLLQVLGFAAFFALVLKKVDQEEYGEPQIDDSLKNSSTFSCFTFVLHYFVWGKTPKQLIHEFKFPSQMILTQCEQQEETAHAVSISHHPQLT